uniref:NADH dehydrogenase [ubiquinone] 1 alpha subcomplex subunit 12 n=1 Tax=Steinernema glaseri TaxID=37863 RepID=A0A1I8AUU2_9BILA
MGIVELLGVDKLIKFGKVVKQIGGVRAALKQRYLMDVTRAGTLVGEDKFGNKYYEDNSFFMPRNRWVQYPDRVWLDYDASQIPPEWHRWLHHIGNETPVEKPPNNPKWVLDHEENLSIIPEKKYIPYSTTRAKVEGWMPGQSKQ